MSESKQAEIFDMRDEKSWKRRKEEEEWEEKTER